MSCCKAIARCYAGGVSKTSQQDMELVSLPYCPTFTLENCVDLGPWPLVITEKFHSTEDIGWYVSAYLLSV
jgi:hypothetical protein